MYHAAANRSRGYRIRPAEQVVDPRDKRILEVGWGDGRITSLLSGPSGWVTALDVNVHSVCHERGRWVRTDFLAASGESLPFSGGTFDLVIFSQSLHHQDSRKALEEAASVLKPNGRIVILEPAVGTDLESVCSLFENEMEQRMEALYAVFDSGMEIDHREAIHTVWRFKDRDALHQWLCDYYHTAHNLDLENRIDAVLGAKATSTPLDLGETLLLICLKPGASSRS